jgi:hypothetical protein
MLNCFKKLISSQESNINLIGLKGLNPFNSDNDISNINDSNDSNDNQNNNIKTIHNIKQTKANGETIEIDLDSIDNIDQIEISKYIKKIWSLEHNFPKNILETKLGRSYQELEFFNTNDLTGKTPSFYDNINCTLTNLGNIYLQNMLLHPITDINILKNRQQALLLIKNKYESNNENILHALDKDLGTIKLLESELLSYYRPETEELKTVLDTVYFQFKILNKLNYQERFLNIYNYFIMFISPFYGIVSPIIFLIMPVIFMKYVMKSDINLKTYWTVMKNMFFKTHTGTSIFKKVLDSWIHEIESPTLKLGFRLFSFIIYLINSPFGRYGYLGLIFVTYVYSIYNYFTTTKSLNKIINYLHTYINRVRKLLDVSNYYFKNIRCLELEEHQNLVNLIENTFNNTLIKKIMKESTFTENPSWFSNKGIILYTYKLLHDEQQNSNTLLTPIFQYISILDAWSSIFRCYKQHQPMNIVEYLDPEISNNKPQISMLGLRNVCCSPSIENNLVLGIKDINDTKNITENIIDKNKQILENTDGQTSKESTIDEEQKNEEEKEKNADDEEKNADDKEKNADDEEKNADEEQNKVDEEENNKEINNMLLSGPNGSGKSTYIKSVLTNIILAQTIGFSFCQEMKLTPFHNFITHLNIPDCQGKESLFQAEMNRCYQYLQELNELESQNNFSFNIIDEIFVSTNYKEGISGAYAIIKKLSQYNNSLSIITTHFDKITKMNHNNIIKKHFSLDTNQNGEIVSDYKLKNGINKKHMAIKLLAKKGFDKDLIKDAEEMYQELD